MGWSDGGGGDLRVGVVGCGYWGSKHVRVLHAIRGVARVVAIDPFEDRTAALKQAFPNMPSFPDLDAALDHVDAVVIATPPGTHAEVALAALAAGKSVLVEKPLATSSADAARMIQAAERSSLTLMVGHTFEHNAAVWKLRELVDTGELGQIHYVDTARLNLGLYQRDVNVVWDLAPHDVSICNHVLGTTPFSVEAWGSRHAHNGLEDVAYLRLQYPGGVIANIHVSWLDPCKVRRVTVVGSAKMAVYNDLASEERVRLFDKGVTSLESQANVQDIPMSYRYGEIRSPYIAFEEPLTVMDRHFLSCVEDGIRPSTDGKVGLAVVQALECAAISLRERRQVDIGELSRPAGLEPELAGVA
jgi:predicted dehydrogenase